MARRLRASPREARLRVDPAHPVVRVRVDPRVWQTALRLAERNRRRLEVRPDGSVLVRNRPA